MTDKPMTPAEREFTEKVEIVAKILEGIFIDDDVELKEFPLLSRLPKTSESWIGFTRDAKKIFMALYPVET